MRFSAVFVVVALLLFHLISANFELEVPRNRPKQQQSNNRKQQQGWTIKLVVNGVAQ